MLQIVQRRELLVRVTARTLGGHATNLRTDAIVLQAAPTVVSVYELVRKRSPSGVLAMMALSALRHV